MVKMIKIDGISHVWYMDTYEELIEATEELHSNPDFTYIGWFNMLQDIENELEYQGLSLKEIGEINRARYGNVLEVLEYCSEYLAFIGTR